MIKEFTTSIAYVCLYCSSITVKDMNVFNLSSEEPNSYFCDGETACKAICVTIKPKRSIYEILVTCPVCEDTHVFNIKKVRFWDNEKPIVLKCPETGIGILFVGKRDEITALVYEQENSILEKANSLCEEDELTLLFSIVEEINRLASKKQISCSCGSHKITISIDSDAIILACQECGNEKEILTSEEELYNLLKASAIVLE